MGNINPAAKPLVAGRAWLVWVVSLVAWTAVALLTAWFSYTWMRAERMPGSFASQLVIPLVNCLIYAALTPILFLLAARFPIEKRSWARRVPSYLLAVVLFSAVHVAARILVYPIKDSATGQAVPVSTRLFRAVFLYDFPADLLYTFLPVVIIGHAAVYYRRLRERELKAAQLETRLAQAQLRALKSQLQPHFLFNTMHSISALMHRNIADADRMMAQLSDLLRMALEDVGAQEVCLSREVEFVSGYLAIEQTRFKDRLTVDLAIEDATWDAQVPCFLLQPLAENAVRHGLASCSFAGKIRISATRQNGSLLLTVSDNGNGIKESGRSKSGIGLSVTRQRLEMLYGSRQSLEVRQCERGVTVAVEIPFRLPGLQLPADVRS